MHQNFCQTQTQADKMEVQLANSGGFPGFQRRTTPPRLGMTSWAPVCEVPCRGPLEGLCNVGNRFSWKVNAKGDFLFLKYVWTHALNLRGTLSYVIILGTLPQVALVKRQVSQRGGVTTYPKAESQRPAPVSIGDLPSPDVEVRGAPWGCLAELRGAGARVRLDRGP